MARKTSHAKTASKKHAKDMKIPADSQNAIDLLKADHRKVEELFAAFKKAKRSDQNEHIAKQVCMELAIHAMIEEELFYPALNKTVDAHLLDEAYVEHDGAKLLIAELHASKASDEFFDAKMTVLTEEIAHHVREEEKPLVGIFSQAKRSGVDLDLLGAKLAERKQQLKEKFEKEGLPPPKTRTLHGAKLSYGKPVTLTRQAA